MKALKSLLRPALILTAFALGFFVPQAGSWSFLIRYLLMVMLFLVFLQVKYQALKPTAAHWKIIGANIVIALGAWGAAHFSGRPELVYAAFFTGISPTASAAPVIMHFLGGSVEFMVTGFLVTNFGVTLALAGLLPIITGNFTLAFLGNVLTTLFLVIGVPCATAAIVRRIWPAAQELPKKLSGFSFCLWLVMLFLCAGSASAFIRNTPGLSPVILLEIAGISLGLCILNFALGYLLSSGKFRRESSQALGQKNTMYTLYLAMNFAGPLPALGPTFYVLWHNLWNAIQMFFHDAKEKNNERR